MSYDYKYGKKRILDALRNEDEVKKVERLPLENDIKYANGVETWATAVYVQIKNWDKLTENENKKTIAKYAKIFPMELVKIFEEPDEFIREVRVDKDYVYAIYDTPSKESIYEVLYRTFYINTFNKMITKLLAEKNLEPIEIGIGISTNPEFMVKIANAKHVYNNKIWLGTVLENAKALAEIAYSKIGSLIAISEATYTNVIDLLEKQSKDAKKWFDEHTHPSGSKYYGATIAMNAFEKWIDDGM